MSATSLDLSQIKTDALSAAASFRSLIGLGASNTPTFVGTTLTGGTITTSTPLVNGTQTWNSAATVFTAMRVNVTDTASSVSSLLMDLQTGGTSRLSVRKNGAIYGNGANPYLFLDQAGGSQLVYGNGILNNGGSAILFSISGVEQFRVDNVGQFKFRNIGAVSWSSTNSSDGAADLVLARDAANTLAQRNATAAQRSNLYGTFTNSSNYERMFLEYNTIATAYRIGTERAGTGSARALELQTDGTTRMSISAAGAVTIGAVTLPATDGTSGQVLATNGSGVATWQTRATRAFAVAMAVAL